MGSRSEIRTFTSKNLKKNNDVEYKFVNSTSLYEAIYLSLETMLYNQVSFIPRNSFNGNAEPVLKVCSQIPQLAIHFSYTRNNPTQELPENVIEQIEQELNSMLDFANLISANDTPSN